VLFGTIGLPGVLAIDLVTFAIGLGSLLRARALRRPDAIDPTARATLSDLVRGAAHHRAHPRLSALLALIVLTFLSIGTLHVLVPTLVIRAGGTVALGLLAALCGGGMAVGAAAISVFGGPRRRSTGVLLGLVGVGAGATALAFSSGLAGWLASSVLFLAAVPLVISCGASIYQSEVPLAEQGRVLAFRNLLALLAAPAAHVTAPPLARAIAALPELETLRVRLGVASTEELSFRVLFLALAACVLLATAGGALLRGRLPRGDENVRSAALGGTDPQRA
jgi:DHA3 family macrolide efflux protein-like MFS transporter